MFREILTLIQLRLLIWKGSFRQVGRSRILKPLMLSVAGLSFLTFEFFFFQTLFHFLFVKVDPAVRFLSQAIALHLLNLIFLVFGMMLLYSNLVTCISVFISARDMGILLLFPYRNGSIFLHKFMETLARSSYMLSICLIPILVTYGMTLGAGAEYYLLLPILLLFYILIPCSVAVPLMLSLALIFPAKRIQQALIAIGLVVTVILLFWFRMLDLEGRLFQGSVEQMLAWASAFKTPDFGWLPSAWLVRTLEGLSHPESHSQPIPWLSLLVCVSLVLFGLAMGVGSMVFRRAWSRALSNPRKSIRLVGSMRLDRILSHCFSRADAAMIQKELKIFFRDLSRWSQLVIMIPLVVFYILNLFLLPLQHLFRGLYFHLNLFMITFIVSAFGARYLFPSVSWEGPALWQILVSPYPVRRLVWIKFFLLATPLVGLAGGLVFLSFRILNFPDHLLPASLLVSLSNAVLLSALAVGLGAWLPKFRYEHHLEVSLGPGGLLYMLTSFGISCLFIGLMALPSFAGMGPRITDWTRWTFATLILPPTPWLIGWVVFSTCLAILVLFLGGQTLHHRERTDF